MHIKITNDTSLWTRRLALYFSLGAGVIVISHVIFTYFGFLHTDVDSARYMLSALVQGEAAIVALVVTLSLVAVQLAAQSYSARVIEVFRRTPDLWILMGIYGVAIFYGLGVLKLIEKANPALNSMSNLEGQVAFSYYLGVFAFVALVPYMLKMFKMLNPSTVINMLAERITNQSILSIEKSVDDDPILPIIDIVRSSLIKYDHDTVREGLRAIKDRVNNILKNEIFRKDRISTGEFLFKSVTSEGEVKYHFEKDKGKEFNHIFAHISRIGKLAASNKNEDSTIEVITTLRENGMTAAKQKLEEATSYAVHALGEVGKASAEQKLNYATLRAVNALEEIGITAATELKFVIMTWDVEQAIEAIKKLADEQKLDDYYLEKINESLSRLSKFTTE
ncbi:MAG: DUF2254 domain-containing protein [Euryarchaeota archaeon]|nr:DUF2254 domain-containing protein [Euryarchaeota archaeon]